MMPEKLVLRVLTRLWPVVFMVLAAMVARADTFSVFSVDGRTDLSGIELYGSSLAVGDLLQVSNARGRTYDVTIARSKLSSSGNRSLSGTTEGNGTFVLVITADGQLQGSLAEGPDFYRILSEDGSPTLQQRDYSALPTQIDEAGAVPEFRPSDSSRHLLELNPTDVKTRSLYKQSKTTTSATGTDTVYPVYNPDTVIDVLVYYDSKMSSPEATVDYLFEYSNLAYARTGIVLTLNLAGLIPVEISSSQDNFAVFDLLKNREAPFSLADEDRASLGADLVHVVRVEKGEEDEIPNCGAATYSVYRGQANRNYARGITEWSPSNGSGRFCSDRSFTHEIGHNLGAAHHRSAYSEPPSSAYDYSFGEGRSAVFKTIMGAYTNTDTIAVFSNPDRDCLGFPCGVSPEYSDSADNRRTLSNTKFFVAAFEGKFDPAALSEVFYDAACNEEGEEKKVGRGAYIRNNSGHFLQLRRIVYLQKDGTEYRNIEVEDGEGLLEPGDYQWLVYDCDDESSNTVGRDIREVYYTYEDPETGLNIEGTHMFFDKDFEGDYGIVRAAAGVGGSVVGNPSIYTRVDAEVEILFEPDYGYKLDEVTGTCPGSLHYNVYTAEPLYGDCWAVASFRPLESNERIQQHFNNLLDTVMFGRGG
ncbi:zinc-dependent metalloprotease [Luminiphilus sp.]|nr:zinc-dependent metalloprotease [Luminiphilus sp.]